MLIDIGAPIIVYFILHSLGVGDVLALTIGAMVTAINAIAGTVRRRRLDSIGLLVVAEIALSIALLLITEDPRILLIKPSFYVGFAAIYAFATCFVGQPIGYESAKPFATKGDPERLAAYERAWECSPEFRRTERVITAGWGVAFLADAVLRVLVVYSFSADQVSESLLLSQVPGHRVDQCRPRVHPVASAHDTHHRRRPTGRTGQRTRSGDIRSAGLTWAPLAA
jgi:hypothetical protein